jgi:hypothetical protein
LQRNNESITPIHCVAHCAGRCNESDENQRLVASVARTLHPYTNTVKILCDVFRIDFESSAFACERHLIEQALACFHEDTFESLISPSFSNSGNRLFARLSTQQT